MHDQHQVFVGDALASEVAVDQAAGELERIRRAKLPAQSKLLILVVDDLVFCTPNRMVRVKKEKKKERKKEGRKERRRRKNESKPPAKAPPSQLAKKEPGAR